MEVAPLRARPYDPTTDVDVASGGEEHVPPESSSRVQTEFVDVYLLAPEENRPIELKDLTIMKPKNNKMHRLVRYFPRCEISYTAAPPPEEKLVTSPRGTTTATTAPRHNGGFSNPSRNTEVFRLKRRLLREYLASAHGDDAAGSDGYPHHHFASGGFHPNTTPQRAYRRPLSPASVSSDAPAPPPLPKYKPIAVGDEDSIQLTSERAKPMTLKARVQYIDSLWPDVAPVDDEDEVMDYYGIEVFIVSEEEREKELKATASAATVGSENISQPCVSPEKKPSESAAAVANASPEKPSDTNAAAVSPQKNEADDENEPPEMTVETRSSALQKLRDAEVKVLPVASKQDDWVQCDKCQKWRRLPNHVNVSELPATWYCKMNRWDKRFNKCSSPEEKLVTLMKDSDLLEYRERKFALDFLQRVKRMEKALLQYKYTDPRDDDGERKYVQCVECLKKRPLLGGMDPSKIPQPFVCWMNWDELRASCSAPQGALPSRDFTVLSGSMATANGSAGGDEPGEKSSKKSGNKSAHVVKHAGENSSKHDTASASGAPSKKASKSGSGGSNNSGSNSKRKPASHGSGSATEKSSGGSGGATSNAKKPKRR